MRKGKRLEKTQPKNNPIDLSLYTIIETEKFPKIYREYWGFIQDCILEFKKKYGEIDGNIYIKIKTSGCVVGITGSQVKNTNGETE